MKSLSEKFFVILAAAASTVACQPGKSAEARPVEQTTPQASEAVAHRFVTAASGNTARYRIREQLVGLDLPNDAVGETDKVSGVISADQSGKLIPAESRFTVDVTNLVSDKDRRDNFVRRRVLQTEQFPSVTLVPKEIRGIALPLPTSGTKSFDIIGDLTVRGVTRPTTWKVNAEFQRGGFTGKASTAFTFKDFSMEQPRVPVVLSVADTIKLELDFSMVKEARK